MYRKYKNLYMFTHYVYRIDIRTEKCIENSTFFTKEINMYRFLIFLYILCVTYIGNNKTNEAKQ
jgi:hypothetical protein